MNKELDYQKQEINHYQPNRNSQVFFADQYNTIPDAHNQINERCQEPAHHYHDFIYIFEPFKVMDPLNDQARKKKQVTYKCQPW